MITVLLIAVLPQASLEVNFFSSTQVRGEEIQSKTRAENTRQVL